MSDEDDKNELDRDGSDGGDTDGKMRCGDGVEMVMGKGTMGVPQ